MCFGAVLTQEMRWLWRMQQKGKTNFVWGTGQFFTFNMMYNFFLTNQSKMFSAFVYFCNKMSSVFVYLCNKHILSFSSPFIIMFLKKFFDGIVPSEMPCLFSWNPYLKTDVTSLLLLFFDKDFKEKDRK